MTAGGDWDVRGLDFESYLVGPVTDKIIDADRMVRERWDNGFPNWTLYRCVYAGDTHLLSRMRDWCVAYAIAVAEAGGVRKGMPAEEMGCLAGWDTYYRLLNHRWVVAGQDIADVAGVHPDTYRRLRNRVYTANLLSLQCYWVELGIAIRRVWMIDRWLDAEHPKNVWRPLAQLEGWTTVASHTDDNGNYWMRAHPIS